MSAFAPLRAATSRWSLTRVSSLLAGGLSGLFLFVWIHQILATFGESLVVTSGVALAIAFGLVLGMWTPVRVPVLRTMPLSILWLVPALWTVAFPWLLDGAVGLLRWCPMVLLTSDTTAFLLLTLLATGLLTVPVTVCVMLTMWPVDCGTSRIASARVPAGSWAGCGVALWLCALVAAPLVGVNVVGLCAALAAAAAFWIGLAKSSDASAVEWSEVSGDATSQPGHPATAQLGTAALALLLGAELAIISRLLLQLMPDGAYLHVSLWSGVLLGIGAGEFLVDATITCATGARSPVACVVGCRCLPTPAVVVHAAASGGHVVDQRDPLQRCPADCLSSRRADAGRDAAGLGLE